jgi:AMIN domain
MLKVSRVLAGRFLAVAASTCVVASSVAQVSVRSVKVLGTKDTVEVEVQASDRIVPETQVLSGPDRLVVDFPNAVPSGQLRNQSIDRADVKNLRVGLFQSKPPITRIVLDLKSARSYQIFPNGRTVMIKVTGDASQSNEVPATVHYEPAPGRPGLIAANYTASAELVTAAPQTPLQVSYREGLLGIHSNKATLSEVLYAIQQHTGADISIPAGAEQEKVVADIPPAPAAEALAKLLNGSRFNFLILNSANDPRQLDRVILSARSEGGFAAPLPPVQEPEPDMTVEEAPVPSPVQPVQGPNPENAPPPAPPGQPADNGPEQ